MPRSPYIRTVIPGPKSKALMQELHRVECPHITYSDRDFPVFWKKAKGAAVEDVDGNRYLDFTAAFGVSNLGHSPSFIEKAMRSQMKEIWHAMGDIHPTEAKVRCAQELTRLLPKSLDQVIFSSSGSEAVESALKTAFIVTGRPGILSFDGAYHGLTYGALQVTSRPFFRDPFCEQVRSSVIFEPFWMERAHSSEEIKKALDRIDGLLEGRSAEPIGAVVIEPIQGRGGIRVADPLFLRGLRDLCSKHKVLLIFDEIYTGFARTGKLFAFEHYGVEPDLLCLGKGMANGFPLSACAGRKNLMAAWGPSSGEARHTSTFLGNPLGCAMALAVFKALRNPSWLKRVNALGLELSRGLAGLVKKFPALLSEARGKGLMQGLVFKDGASADKAVKESLKKGMILLASGDAGDVLTFTPPFVISKEEIHLALKMLGRMFSKLY